MSATAAHPLDAITADEVRRAVELIRADARVRGPTRRSCTFASTSRPRPSCSATNPTRARDPASSRALLVPAARLEAIEVVVSVTDGKVSSWTVHDDMRPALLFGESMSAIVGVKEHPEWQGPRWRRRGHRGLRSRADRSVAGRLVRGWNTSRAAASVGASPTFGTRRPTTGTRAPSRGVNRVSSTRGAGEGARGRRLRRRPDADRPWLVPPGRRRPCPHGSEAAGDRPTRGVASFVVDGKPRALVTIGRFRVGLRPL